MHYCYQNGKIISLSEASMQLNDLGLLRGYALFDYFRTYNKRPFQWDMYWNRFEKSAKILNLSVPISKKNAYATVMKLIDLNGLENCAIRFLLTGGYAPDSISAVLPNLLIISEDLHGANQKDYETGINIISHDYLRDLPQVKSTDYKHLMLLLNNIKLANASDVLYHKRGYISELSRSNVFLFKEDKLISPHKNILQGITRKVVLSLAKPHFEIEQRNVKLSELYTANEVFTTSTNKKVLGITKIDNQVIADGNVGEKTKFLYSLFEKLVTEW